MRIGYINSLRLLATVSVVFLHTSAGILDNYPLDFCNKFALSVYKYAMVFSVPLFVMISGALFLNPSKRVDYPLLMHKYVRRIALALLIFGLPMCLAEQYFTGRGNGIVKFLTGYSWSHLWYLYMLVGLYLLTPLIKPYVNGASGRDLKTALGVLFVLSSLMPTLRIMGVHLKSYLLLPPYVFIYILGYCLCWRRVPKILRDRRLLAAAILAIVAITALKCYHGIPSVYADPLTIGMAAALFLLMRQSNASWAMADKCSPYCFGIYLVHPIFINFAYKHLRIHETFDGLYLMQFVWFVIFLAAALALTLILMKIPPLKNYVL